MTPAAHTMSPGASSTAPALSVAALERSFGAQQVLRGVDLDVAEGITAVLGASGCGKTTLLRMVAGFVKADRGTVTLQGRLVDGDGQRVPSRQRGIGYVPQEGALFPHLDVGGNIAFGLPRVRRRASAARVHQVLDLVGLGPELAQRYPHQLSGGQQQRVALGRALASDPVLVLLDEPFASLDASLREETGRAVREALLAAGAAALLVTHDRGEAMSLGDQVAVMHEGRFLQVAQPAEVYLRPAAVEVARFVADALVLPGDLSGGRASSGLGTVDVDPAAGVGTDGPCLLAVRREQISVHAGDGVKALVTEVSYFGREAVVRAQLVSPGADLLVSAHVPAQAVPVVGQEVALSVTGPVRAFPEAGAA